MTDHPGSLDTAAEKLQLLWRAMDSCFNGLIITGAPVISRHKSVSSSR